jgi:hypothetical protein
MKYDSLCRTAEPGLTGECLTCKSKLIAKCGDIKVWRWAHASPGDCDPRAEGGTEWHLGWKNDFVPGCQEVAMGPHRADVRTGRGTVIEFRHSPISPEEIRERGEFYKDLARPLGRYDYRRWRERMSKAVRGMNNEELVTSNNWRKVVGYEKVERITTHCIYGHDAWTSWLK